MGPGTCPFLSHFETYDLVMTPCLEILHGVNIASKSFLYISQKNNGSCLSMREKDKYAA